MNRWVRIGLQLASLGLFVLILWLAGPEAWQTIRQGDRTSLAIASLLYGAAGVASASRLRLITQAIHSPETASWRQFFQANWVARSLGLILPRSVSAVGGKSVALRSFGVPTRRAVWVVMVDNLFDVLLLAGLCLPAFFYFRGRLTEPELVVGMVVMVMVLLTAVWQATSPRWSHPFTNWITRIPFLARKLNFEDEPAKWLPPPKAAVGALAWSMLLNGVLAAGFFFMAKAVQVDASWPLFLAAYPFVQLSLVAAVTPGGLGIFDLGWLGLLALGGVAEEQALTFVVAQRAYVAVFVLIWTGFSILLAFTDKTPLAAPKETEPPQK